MERPDARRLGGVTRHLAAAAAATVEGGGPRPEQELPLSWSPTAELTPSAADIALFKDTGLLVLRGVLTHDEIDRLHGPHQRMFEDLEYDGRDQITDPSQLYPAPGTYSMGPKILDRSPEVAAVSCGHPKIVAAVETLFGEPAVLAQYWSIMRPPGAGVPQTGEWTPGKTAHYDYKPWRCVGSVIKWMFAVIPFVDYTAESGPLAVAPGSYKRTVVLPSDGRIHRVDASQVPPPAVVGPMLVDPQLRRGDVVLMQGFTFHEAWPNTADVDRCGLYMKFNARSSPPACGPTIFPRAAFDFLADAGTRTAHVVRHNRSDGCFAQVSETSGDDHGIEQGRLLIEDARGAEGRVLLVPTGAAGGRTSAWGLPVCAASDDPKASILDVCNVVGSVTRFAAAELGLRLPWLSWLRDLPATVTAPAGGGSRSRPRRLQSEQRCRVFAHRITDQDAWAAPDSPASTAATAAAAAARGIRWVSADELAALAAAGECELGGAEVELLQMWQLEQDEDGNAVTRSFGLPSTDVSK
eukprot:SAG11_NODE_5280_length_1607_cov_2.866711_1_plen_523_part_01